jgi:hypothetical protein
MAYPLSEADLHPRSTDKHAHAWSNLLVFR